MLKSVAPARLEVGSGLAANVTLRFGNATATASSNITCRFTPLTAPWSYAGTAEVAGVLLAGAGDVSSQRGGCGAGAIGARA